MSALAEIAMLITGALPPGNSTILVVQATCVVVRVLVLQLSTAGDCHWRFVRC